MTDRTDNKTVKIAVLTDIHYGDDNPSGNRRCSIGHILLERAVRRLNGLIKPDVVVMLGDILNDGTAAGTEERLRKTRGILDRLNAPYIAIPGNHDGDPVSFYEVFDKPENHTDIAGIRFLAFVDKEEPGYNASRSKADIQRIRAARSGYSGHIVALQHVCLFPPEKDIAPYNYHNAEDIISELKKSGVILSVSGHHHNGSEDYTEDGVTFVTAPGMCEAPFPFLTIDIDVDAVSTQRHELVMPRELNLVDNHIHTELAYCSENMTVEKSIELAHDFGLAGVTFTEHSGQLYFDTKPYWRNVWLNKGMAGAEEEHNRMSAYLDLKQKHESDFARFSLEVECDAKGKLILKPDDREHFQAIMGTVHGLPGLSSEKPPGQSEVDDFLFMVESLAKKGVTVLAHPLRLFRRSGWEPPTELFEPVSDLLREYNIAAEINIHSDNVPPADFLRCCLERDVKFSFGSDSHSLAEIGDFTYHISLLRNAGYDGDISDVLIKRPL